MTREDLLQASRTSSSVKQDMTSPGSEETPDTKTRLPAGAKQARKGGHADDRSGSD